MAILACGTVVVLRFAGTLTLTSRGAASFIPRTRPGPPFLGCTRAEPNGRPSEGFVFSFRKSAKHGTDLARGLSVVLEATDFRRIPAAVGVLLGTNFGETEGVGLLELRGGVAPFRETTDPGFFPL